MTKKLRVRHEWLAAWLTLGRQDRVTAPELAEQVAALLEDIAECQAAIGVASAPSQGDR